MRIWKWTLAVTDLQSLPIPEGARLLTVQAQGDMPQLWALVDEKAPILHHTFATYGTGNPMPDGDPGAYVGTYQISGGALVFHVFEPFNVGGEARLAAHQPSHTTTATPQGVASTDQLGRASEARN